MAVARRALGLILLFLLWPVPLVAFALIWLAFTATEWVVGRAPGHAVER